MASIFRDQVLQIIVFQTVLLLIALSNSWYLYRARKHASPRRFPTVSVLVPARNEEKNIRKCIQSLLAQDYPSFEVLVLDDQSTDATRSILAGMSSKHAGLRVLVGSPPPTGVAGKNWACTQLAKQAQGDLLFFTDADTVHQPGTLTEVVTAMLGEQADMLTGYPRQEMHTWGERLLVPFFSWASLCFNPLWLAYKLRLPVLSTAVGQMMIFRREAYDAVGGHQLLGDTHIDDMTLARRIKGAGLRWRMVNIADLVACRMYGGSKEAFHGFAKHYFAAFDFRLVPYLFVFIWLAVMFWKPLVLLAQHALGRPVQAQLWELILCVGLALLLWLTGYMVLKIPLGLAFLYPVSILAVEVVAVQSLWHSLTGRLNWKERALAKPRWKLF